MALSDVRLFHGSMLLAAVHMFWLGHPLETIHEAYLHHKLEAISLLTSHLDDPLESRSDATVCSIACLALSEVRMTVKFEILQELTPHEERFGRPQNYGDTHKGPLSTARHEKR